VLWLTWFTLKFCFVFFLLGFVQTNLFIGSRLKWYFFFINFFLLGSNVLVQASILSGRPAKRALRLKY
jgi:hypothetical protein